MRVLRPGATVLLADFMMPKKGGWRIVAVLTGQVRGDMVRRVPPLEPLVGEAGFTDLASGDVPPWLVTSRRNNYEPRRADGELIRCFGLDCRLLDQPP